MFHIPMTPLDVLVAVVVLGATLFLAVCIFAGWIAWLAFLDWVDRRKEKLD